MEILHGGQSIACTCACVCALVVNRGAMNRPKCCIVLLDVPRYLVMAPFSECRPLCRIWGTMRNVRSGVCSGRRGERSGKRGIRVYVCLG